MRILKTEELIAMKAVIPTEEELLKADPVWCVICEKFVPFAEKIDGRVFFRSFKADNKIGGWCCSWHDLTLDRREGRV